MNRMKLKQEVVQKLGLRSVGVGILALSLLFLVPINNDKDLDQVEIVDSTVGEEASEVVENLIETEDSPEIEVQKELAPSTNASKLVSEAKVRKTQSAKISSTAQWGAMALDVQAQGAEISWSMSAMNFADEFVLERSLNNKDFQKLASQKADDEYAYTLNDKSFDFLGMPRVYYRLQMKGLDGKKFYSPIKKYNNPLKLGLYGLVDIQSSEIICQYASDKQEEIHLFIEDESGQVLHQSKVEAGPDAATQRIKIKDLGKGIYTLLLKSQEAEFRSDFVMEG